MCLFACAGGEKEVPGLIKELGSSDARVRSQAALKLARIGPPYANRAERELIALLDDSNTGVQSAAAYALTSIGTKSAMEAYESHKKR
jgi:HEAT repeat protein